MSHHFGAKVAPGEKREYGKAMVSRAKVRREGGSEGGEGRKELLSKEGRIEVNLPFLPSLPFLLPSLPQGHEENAEVLFKGLPESFQMWMSHGDKLHSLPEG